VAQLILTFDQVVLDEIITAAAAAGRYRSKIPATANLSPHDPVGLIPNPESLTDFGERMVRRMLLDLRKQHRVEQAMAAARNAELATLTE